MSSPKNINNYEFCWISWSLSTPSSRTSVYLKVRCHSSFVFFSISSSSPEKRWNTNRDSAPGFIPERCVDYLQHSASLLQLTYGTSRRLKQRTNCSLDNIYTVTLSNGVRVSGGLMATHYATELSSSISSSRAYKSDFCSPTKSWTDNRPDLLNLTLIGCLFKSSNTVKARSDNHTYPKLHPGPDQNYV